MSASRTYGQHCSVAHALDLLGERWTLLLVRELMLGPKRYRDLLERLPMGTNLLAARLKRLEENGIVVKTVLPPPASVTAYELTDVGEGLRRPLEELALWGFHLLPEPGAGGTMRAAWAALVMAATARRAGGPGLTGIVELHVGDEVFWLRCTRDDLVVRDGPAPLPPDATARMDAPAFYALATGAARVDDAPEVEGDAVLVRRLFEVARLPVSAA